jgi:hypothetical protein
MPGSLHTGQANIIQQPITWIVYQVEQTDRCAEVGEAGKLIFTKTLYKHEAKFRLC